MSMNAIDRLIADAAACKQCGKEHTYGPKKCTCTPDCKHIEDTYGWGSAEDGHAYYRKTITVDWLRLWRDDHSGGGAA